MISVLIPVYNNWELTRACLEALAASRDGQELEVIVVDNASSDATPQAIWWRWAAACSASASATCRSR